MVAAGEKNVFVTLSQRATHHFFFFLATVQMPISFVARKFILRRNKNGSKTVVKMIYICVYELKVATAIS